MIGFIGCWGSAMGGSKVIPYGCVSNVKKVAMLPRLTDSKILQQIDIFVETERIPISQINLPKGTHQGLLTSMNSGWMNFSICFVKIISGRIGLIQLETSSRWNFHQMVFQKEREVALKTIHCCFKREHTHTTSKECIFICIYTRTSIDIWLYIFIIKEKSIYIYLWYYTPSICLLTNVSFMPQNKENSLSLFLAVHHPYLHAIFL